MLRAMTHGGDIIADVLARHGVTHLFTLCGGHISPILTGAQTRGLRVVDVRDEATAVFAAAAVPGPVFVEVPVDLLYPEATVREWYAKEAGLGKAKGIAAKAVELYIRGHLYRQFRAPVMPEAHVPALPSLRGDGGIERAAEAIKGALRPVFVIGSQALVGVKDPARVARALGMLGVPVFLGGMARGLLGKSHELQLRHHRSEALKRADVIVVCGFPFDFRLGYGRGLNRDATLIAANLSPAELRKNRKPDIALEMHAAEFIVGVADRISSAGDRFRPWLDELREKERARDADIAGRAQPAGELVDPIHLFLRMEEAMADDAVLVVDGGDFVATASYIVRPRAPLRSE